MKKQSLEPFVYVHPAMPLMAVMAVCGWLIIQVLNNKWEPEKQDPQS